MSHVDAEPVRRAPRVRLLSLAVLLVVAGIAIAGCLVTRQVVSDQEKKLLRQRTDEAALYLSSAFGGVQSVLSSAAATAAVNHADPQSFMAAAAPLTASAKNPQGFTSVALVRTTPTPAVVATAGAPIAAIGPERTAAVQTVVAKAKKAPSGALLAMPLFDGNGTTRRLGFVYAAPQLPGYIVYAENIVNPAKQSPVTAGQPFSELIAAIYAVPEVRADQLVVATAGAGHLPLRGKIASAKSPIGLGDPWLLVAKARRPLVGSVANVTPWAILGAGLLAAVLATVVVEVLGRRREYATAVADERTRELKQSLEDLASAHEQLVRQERLAAIGELASTIGHELRNPLGVISNALYLLGGDIAKRPDEAAQRHLATAEREVSAATVIVSDLLEFARQRDPVPIDVDVVGLVDEVLSVLPPPSGISVSRDMPAQRVTALVDRDMLRQVLLNLVGNAYQAMPEGGSVTVSVDQDTAGVHLDVVDTGPGMTPEVRDKVFQPFFTTKARGVGLGLAVSRRIVEAHSGTLDVESLPGDGARFVITLPQIPVPPHAVPHQAGPVEATNETVTGVKP